MPSNAASSISGPISVPGARGSPIFTWREQLLAAAPTSSSATLSWTISRRSVVQRWPAVPAAENRIARAASSRSALGATIIALLPPSSSSTRPKRCGDARADRAAHRGRAGRRDQRDARIVDQRLADVALALDAAAPARPAHRRTAQRPAHQRHHRFGAERRLLARLPDHRIAADQRQRRIPRPHRDREIERADHQHRPERMPLLHHPVVGPLAGDGQAVELARQADREVADVDHLLDFAEALLDDLAGFERDQLGEHRLGLAQLLAEQADQLAAARRRHRRATCRKAVGRPLARRRSGSPLVDPPDRLAVDRRIADELAGRVDRRAGRGSGALPRRGSCQQLLRFGHRRDAGIDRLVLLAEAQPDEVARRVVLGEGGQRHDRDAGLARPRRRRSSRRRAAMPDACEVDAQEIGRGGVEHGEAGVAQALASCGRGRAAKRSRIGSIHASPSSSPNATAACRLGAVQKVRNWCARATTLASSGAATIHPTFHPVSEKILPAEPILIVRSAMPGSVASGVNGCAVEQDMLPHLVADHDQVMVAGDRGDRLRARRRRTAARRDCADC